MKKNYLNWLGLGLISTLVLASCMSETEVPLTNELSKTVEKTTAVVPGGENLRKSPNGIFYQEKFSNLIDFVPDIDGGWVQGMPAPGWYPGTGIGNATHIGKAYSFINQYAVFGPNGLITVGAPVTKAFALELEKLGITEIPDEVNSITTDGKGNAIFFKNGINVTTTQSDSRIDFKAEVEIMGGRGIFKTATGTGEVNGFFNPQNGKGETTLRANINF